LLTVTEKGAKANANLYSVVETAKANSVKPSVYLKEIFTRLPAANCAEDIEALLPWNIYEDGFLGSYNAESYSGAKSRH
jgi:transposase